MYLVLYPWPKGHVLRSAGHFKSSQDCSWQEGGAGKAGPARGLAGGATDFLRFCLATSPNPKCRRLGTPFQQSSLCKTLTRLDLTTDLARHLTRNTMAGTSSPPPAASTPAVKKVLGKVLADAFSSGMDQISELQRERQAHALETPDVLDGEVAQEITPRLRVAVMQNAAPVGFLCTYGLGWLAPLHPTLTPALLRRSAPRAG